MEEGTTSRLPHYATHYVGVSGKREKGRGRRRRRRSRIGFRNIEKGEEEEEVIEVMGEEGEDEGEGEVVMEDDSVPLLSRCCVQGGHTGDTSGAG